MDRKTILSVLLLATTASMSAGVFATDNDMPTASEAFGAYKMKPHSYAAEKAGASAASAPAAAPAEDTKGRDKSKHLRPDTKQVCTRAQKRARASIHLTCDNEVRPDAAKLVYKAHAVAPHDLQPVSALSGDGHHDFHRK